MNQPSASRRRRVAFVHVRAALKMGRDLILGKRGPRRTAKPRTARYRALDGAKRSTCAEMVGKALLVGVCGLLLILVVVAYAVLDAAGLVPSSPLQPM